MRLLLLTGGSRGIGLALTRELVADGFAVMEFSRTAPHSYSVATDFSLPLEAHRVVEGKLASVEVGQLEELLVVCNAATLEPIGPTAHKPAAAVVENLSVNLASPVLFASAAIAHFQAVPCRKVVASITAGVAHQPVFGWSLYCAAKVAMEAFIRTVATEQQGQPYPFLAVNIDPGVVDTQMHAVAASAPPLEFPAAGRFAARRAQGKLSSPASAAAAIASLLLSPTLVSGAGYDARNTAA